MSKYATKRKIKFTITKPTGQAKAETINIDPSRIIDIDESTNSFIVRSTFNPDSIYKYSLQGERVRFKPRFYDKLKELESKSEIKKIE